MLDIKVQQDVKTLYCVNVYLINVNTLMYCVNAYGGSNKLQASMKLETIFIGHDK